MFLYIYKKIKPKRVIPTLQVLHLNIVGSSMCLYDPGSYTNWDLGPWWQFCGKDQTNCNAWLGLSDGLMTYPRKINVLLLKPETLFKIAVWQRSVEPLRVTERE